MTFVTNVFKSSSSSCARCIFSAKVLEKSLNADWHLMYSGSFLTAAASPAYFSTIDLALAAAPL